MTLRDLEDSDISNYENFQDLIFEDILNLDLETLKIKNHALKKTYTELLTNMSTLHNRYQEIGSVHEANVILQRRAQVRDQFKTRIESLRSMRIQQGDDTLSTAPSSEMSQENLALLHSESPAEKLNRYLSGLMPEEDKENVDRQIQEASGAIPKTTNRPYKVGSEKKTVSSSTGCSQKGSPTIARGTSPPSEGGPRRSLEELHSQLKEVLDNRSRNLTPLAK